MSTQNSVRLIGRIGHDLELKSSDSSTRVSFQLATNEFYGKGEDKKQKTEWHPVTAWGKAAETIVKLLKKGDQVAIDGKLRGEEYEKDGVKVKGYHIEVENFLAL